ncbi:Os09g0397800, partial [Oryza sativa Japonica Group]
AASPSEARLTEGLAFPCHGLPRRLLVSNPFHGDRASEKPWLTEGPQPEGTLHLKSLRRRGQPSIFGSLLCLLESIIGSTASPEFIYSSEVLCCRVVIS